MKVTNRDGSPSDKPWSVFTDPDAAKKLMPEHNGDGEIILGNNMVVNLGRQTLAHLAGGKGYNSVVSSRDWIISYASFGTYDEAPRFTDSTLSPQPTAGVFVGGDNQIAYDGENYLLPIASVDWPQPFVTRFEIILGADHCVGSLIREMGLWSGNGTLFARKCFVAIEKTSEFGLTFLWRVRF